MNGNRAVRIIPAHLEFSDVQPNKVQKIHIVVKNIDKHSREIRCHPPQSKVGVFMIKCHLKVNRVNSACISLS